jgi:hypothetical protein
MEEKVKKRKKGVRKIMPAVVSFWIPDSCHVQYGFTLTVNSRVEG